MAHNSLVRGGVGSGAWTNYVVLHGPMEQIDQYIFQSINGDLGGTWAPAARIIVGGSGLNTTGVFIADGTATFNAASTFNSNVSILAPSTVSNTMTINGAGSGQVSFNTGSILHGDNGANMTWAADYTFSHTGTFSAKPTINAALDVTGLATFSGNVATTATLASAVVTVATSLACLSGAGILYRYLAGPDADTTIGAGTADIVRIGTITANRVYTLSNATNGMAILITMVQATASGANTVTVKDAAAATLVVLKFQQAGQIEKALLVYTGGLWVVADFEYYAIT